MLLTVVAFAVGATPLVVGSVVMVGASKVSVEVECNVGGTALGAMEEEDEEDEEDEEEEEVEEEE